MFKAVLKKSSTKALYKKTSSNFKIGYYNSQQFAKFFNFDMINKFVIDSHSGKIFPQHTVVVIDDAHIHESTVHRLVSEGRQKGISVVFVSQDFKKDNMPESVRNQAGLLMITSPLAGGRHITRAYVGKTLKVAVGDRRLEHAVDMISSMKKGELITINSDVDKFMHLPVISQQQQ